MLTTLWSWLRGRGASWGSSVGRLGDYELPSTFRVASAGADGGVRMDAIAIVEPLEPGSSGVLDTESCFSEWQDVESAMRHVGVLYPGRYTVFLEPSGRIFLQAEAESRGRGPSVRHCPRGGTS